MYVATRSVQTGDWVSVLLFGASMNLCSHVYTSVAAIEDQIKFCVCVCVVIRERLLPALVLVWVDDLPCALRTFKSY